MSKPPSPVMSPTATGHELTELMVIGQPASCGGLVFTCATVDGALSLPALSTAVT
jgi:hypothetical protein